VHISLAQAQKDPYFNDLVSSLKENLGDIGSTINQNTQDPESSGLPEDNGSSSPPTPSLPLIG
jgi:hypothetical protein